MCSVPDDFLELAANGMAHLDKCKCSNVIYLMCQALGSMRSNQSDTLLPAKRMPMGLIEYIVNFFTSGHIKEVHIHLIAFAHCFFVNNRLNAQLTIALGFRQCMCF